MVKNKEYKFVCGDIIAEGIFLGTCVCTHECGYVDFLLPPGIEVYGYSPVEGSFGVLSRNPGIPKLLTIQYAAYKVQKKYVQEI